MRVKVVSLGNRTHELTSVKLYQTGTFRTLYRLSYRAVATRNRLGAPLDKRLFWFHSSGNPAPWYSGQAVESLRDLEAITFSVVWFAPDQQPKQNSSKQQCPTAWASASRYRARSGWCLLCRTRLARNCFFPILGISREIKGSGKTDFFHLGRFLFRRKFSLKLIGSVTWRYVTSSDVAFIRRPNYRCQANPTIANSRWLRGTFFFPPLGTPSTSFVQIAC